MKKRWGKIRIPFIYVKPICIVTVLLGIFFFAAGSWIASLCMLLGAYIIERNQYCCPGCHRKLDMKQRLMKTARCPFCSKVLRK